MLIGNNVKYAESLLKQLRDDMLEQIRPYKYLETDHDSILHRREESFVRLCLDMERKGINSPENMNTYKFYKSVEIIKEEVDRQLRKNGHN